MHAPANTRGQPPAASRRPPAGVSRTRSHAGPAAVVLAAARRLGRAARRQSADQHPSEHGLPLPWLVCWHVGSEQRAASSEHGGRGRDAAAANFSGVHLMVAADWSAVSSPPAASHIFPSRCGHDRHMQDDRREVMQASHPLAAGSRRPPAARRPPPGYPGREATGDPPPLR